MRTQPEIQIFFIFWSFFEFSSPISYDGLVTKYYELNIWTLFCNVYVQFLSNQIWKEIALQLDGKTCKCEHITQLIIPSKTCVLYFIWIVSDKNHLEFNISHILSPKLKKLKIPLNHVHRDLSKNTKPTSQFPHTWIEW